MDCVCRERLHWGQRGNCLQSASELFDHVVYLQALTLLCNGVRSGEGAALQSGNLSDVEYLLFEPLGQKREVDDVQIHMREAA
jgi:hypothetical protein